MPTLADESSLLEFIAFTGNSDCRLPCWIGIIPNENTWEEVIFSFRALQPVAAIKTLLDVDGLYGKENVLGASYYGEQIRVGGRVSTMLSNQNRVYSIELDMLAFLSATEDTPSQPLPLPEAFRMKSVLKEYGVPELAFLSTDTGVPGPILYLSTLLVYPKQHFYIEYHRTGKLVSNKAEYCDPDSFFYLVIVEDGEKLASVETIANTPETEHINIEFWRPLDQVMNLSLAKFHEKYGLSNTECIIFESKGNGW